MKSRDGRVVIWVLALAGLTISGLGQSGRSRPPVTAPPKPQPETRGVVTGPVVLGIPEGGKLAGQESAGGTGRFRLRNELTAVIRERHSVPLVVVEVAVSVGWADESAGLVKTDGMAGLVQEILMGGPAGGKSGSSPLETAIARLGGRLTSRLEAGVSSIQVVVPAESYAELVGMLAGTFLEPDLSAGGIDRGRLRLELREREGQSSLRSAEADRVRGRKDLAAETGQFTPELVAAFYRRFYHPRNMVVTVVGDIFSLPALGQIQMKFGALSGSRESFPVEVAAAKTGTLQYSHSRANIRQSLVTIGYRLTGPDGQAGPAGRKLTEAELRERSVVEVLAAVLGLGRGSRLYQGLRDGQASRDKSSVAVAASVWPELGDGDGGRWLIAQLVVDPTRIDRAEAEYLREIERFRREVISEGELRRAIVMLEKRHYDRLETIEDEAHQLTCSQLVDGDYRAAEAALVRRRTVTAVEVQQAAARLLILGQMVVRELEPAAGPARTFTPEKFAELVVTFAPGAARPVSPEEVKPATVLKTFQQGAERMLPVNEQNVMVAPIPLPVRDFSVLRGPRAYVREDKSRPIIAVTIVFQGGRLQETSATSGTTELVLRSMLRSTTTRRADLIAHELESYGADVRVVNEPDFYGFTIDVLSRNAEPAVKLLLEIIESPFFDRDEVARERAILVAEQEGARDEMAIEAREHLLGSIFPNHPYSLPRLGRAEATGALNAEQLEAWHTRSIRRQYPFVFLVGDTDGSSMVSRIFSDGLKRGELDKTLKISLPTQFPPSQDRVSPAGWPMTFQSIGFRIANQAFSTPIDHLAAAMLAEMIRSGPQLAETLLRNGLTSDIRVGVEQQLAGSFFHAEVVSLPANETVVLDQLSREFQRLVNSVATEAEFELARNAAIGRYAIDLQSHARRTLEYARAALIGRKPADVEGQPEAMIGVRRSDLKRVAEGIFKNSAGGRGILRGERPTSP